MQCRPLCSSVVGALGAVVVIGASVGGVAGCDPNPTPVDDDDFIPVIEVPDCRPNNDGVIEAAELPVVVGATARVGVGQGVEVAIKPAKSAANPVTSNAAQAA